MKKKPSYVLALEHQILRLHQRMHKQEPNAGGKAQHVKTLVHATVHPLSKTFLSKTYTKFNSVLYSTLSVAFGECSFRSGLHNDGSWESE